MSASGLLPGLCADDGLERVDHAVLQLQGLDQVRVPDHSSVGELQVRHLLVELVHLGDALLKNLPDKFLLNRC